MDSIKSKILGKETSGNTILYFEDGANLDEIYTKIKSQKPVDGEIFDVSGKVICIGAVLDTYGKGIALTIYWKKYYEQNLNS